MHVLGVVIICVYYREISSTIGHYAGVLALNENIYVAVLLCALALRSGLVCLIPAVLVTSLRYQDYYPYIQVKWLKVPRRTRPEFFISCLVL